MTNKKATPVKSPLAKEDEKEPEVTPVKPTREYSIIVWGATGFTGQLVCQHIANDYPGHFKWAMAGRSKEKLEEVRAQLEKVDARCGSVPILTAELNDQKALDKLVKQADVIISTAGPFWNIGTPMVDASLRTNTHYCDISGEVLWMHKTTRTLHEAAKAKNIKIVHSCGFDSVPSDLGVFLLSRHMKEALNRPCARIDLLVNEAKGGFSGGSIQSVFAQDNASDAEVEACKDVHCLCPPAPPADKAKADDKAPEQSRPIPEQGGPRFNQRINKWTYPFQFAPQNTRVVYRSNALWDPNSYGPNFFYSESHEAEGPVDAVLGAMGHCMVHLVTTVPLLRSLVAPLLPEPGDGPPEAYRRKNHWKFTLHGWTQEEGRTKSRRCEAIVRGKRDPGYWETSRMVLESALCLALQGQELSDQGYLQGGVLTPATAMGSVLIDRLNNAGITFEITKTGLEKAPTPLDALKPASKGGSSTNALGGAISSELPAAKVGGREPTSAKPSAADCSGATAPAQLPQRRSGSERGRRGAVSLLGVPMRHAHPLLEQPLRAVQALTQQAHGRGRDLGSAARDAQQGLQHSWGQCLLEARTNANRALAHMGRGVADLQRQLRQPMAQLERFGARDHGASNRGGAFQAMR